MNKYIFKAVSMVLNIIVSPVALLIFLILQARKLAFKLEHAYHKQSKKVGVR